MIAAMRDTGPSAMVAPRNVAIQLRSDMPDLLHDVAESIKRRTGARIHGYVATREQLDHYAHRDERGTFASLTVQNLALLALDETLPPMADIMAAARRHEARLGVTYNHVALTNRHLGRGYALLGPCHPRSRYSERATYAHLVHGYNRVFEFWLGEVRERKIDLFLATGKEIAVVARAEGIPYRGLYGARYKNLHFWGDDEYRGSSRIWARYADLSKARRAASVDLEAPYDLARINHKLALKDAALHRAAYFIGRQVARHAYWRLRGYEKGRGYYLGDEVRLLWRRYREWNKLTGRNMASLSSLRNHPFVFFPLQTEPETSIQQGSPEHFYQHAAIAALSRDLPAGVLLAVKETPYGVGRRPHGFYRQLRDIKNVVLLDITVPGFEAVRQSMAVATLVGTAGFEAAVMGKPVISFGRHNIYGCLPHVFVVTDEGVLAGQIKCALDPAFSHDLARDEGRRLLQAIVDCSFNLGAYSYRVKSGHDAAIVESCVNNLFASLAEAADVEVA